MRTSGAVCEGGGVALCLLLPRRMQLRELGSLLCQLSHLRGVVRGATQPFKGV